LQLQGGSDALVDAVAEGKLDSPLLTDKNRALLKYVEKLTLRPAQLRDTDAEALRKAGWEDEEIYEASFITSLFAFFNRMADAYGLEYPPGGYLPPEERAKLKPDGSTAPPRPLRAE
jgi:alkylhydroperoxidase family enzyme